MANKNTPKLLENAFADERDQEFNLEIHNLLNDASDAIDTDGALESINAALPIVDRIRTKLVEERDHRTGGKVATIRQVLKNFSTSKHTNEADTGDEEPEPDIDDAHCVLSFLLASVPLRGIDYSNDERLKFGENLIAKRAAECLTPTQDFFHVKTPQDKLGIAAAILYYVHNSEVRDVSSAGEVRDYHSGICHLLTWAEDLIVDAGGLKV